MDRWRTRSVLVLVASAVYLYGFPSATIPYGVVVLFHAAVGILLTVLLLPFLIKLLRTGDAIVRLGWLLLTAGAVLGVALIYVGTPNRLKGWLFAHIGLCVIGSLFVATSWLASRGWLGTSATQRMLRFAGLVLLTAGIAAGTWWYREVAWNNANRIANPRMPAASIDGEGDGPQGKFSPAPRKPKMAATSPRNISCSRRPASAVTRTSTRSGTAPRTISLHSTISGIAKASSTCRMWPGCVRRNGAPVAMTLRCSSAAFSTSPSRKSWIVPKPKRV